MKPGNRDILETLRLTIDRKSELDADKGTMTRAANEIDDLRQSLKKLVDAIDRKWSLETERRRSNALSPAIEDALSEARGLLGIPDVADIEQYRARFRPD